MPCHLPLKLFENVSYFAYKCLQSPQLPKILSSPSKSFLKGHLLFPSDIVINVECSIARFLQTHWGQECYETTIEKISMKILNKK